MTSRATRTVLRLAPSGRQWIRVPLTSLNLSRHGRIPPAKPKFETLASETTPVPSIQAVLAPAAAGSADAGQGSRIGTPNAGAVPVPDAGSPALEQDTSFRGINVPRKPSPPAEGECCMSGCATCVYDLYLDDLEHFHSQVRDAKRQILATLRAEAAAAAAAAGTGTGTPVDLSGWPESQLGPPPTLSELSDATPNANNRDDGGGGGASKLGSPDPAEVAEREAAEARKQISDPTLRAFLEMEARMKKKQQDQQRKEANREAATPAP